jgi:hypothetical protein
MTKILQLWRPSKTICKNNRLRKSDLEFPTSIYLVSLSCRLLPPLERLGPPALPLHLLRDQHHGRHVANLRCFHEDKREGVGSAEELGAAGGGGHDCGLEHAPPDAEVLKERLKERRINVQICC